MPLATATADLGPLQIELLKRLWNRGSATVHELLRDWTAQPAPAYVTILTVLRRLEKRGLLSHTVEQRTFRWRPRITEEALKRAVLGDLAARVFGGMPELLQFAAQNLANGAGA